MKIKLVRLQNVKSYVDETISFNEGVNFISGVNGAGKTTIIESIGYALFNSKPGNIGEFLRYGQKTGIITIEFEANDGRLYKVVRKFGTSNSWLIYDMETESEIDLHGAADVVPFLKEILGIEPDQDTSQLFDDVIGISQGTFTAPFLESAAGRRDKFNRIFKVESYRSAFTKTAGVIKKIDDAVKALEIRRAENEGRIRDYAEVKARKEELVPVITKLEGDIKEKKQQKDKAEKNRDILRNREKDLQKTSKDIQVKEERVKGLNDSIAKLEEEQKIAEASASLVTVNSEGYRKYVELKKKQEGLEKERKSRDDLKDQLAKGQTAYERTKAEIDTEKKAIASEEADVSAAREATAGILGKARSDAERAKLKLDGVLKVKAQNDEFYKGLGSLENDRNEFVKLQTKLQAGLEKWTELRSNIEKIQANLKREPELLKGAERLKTLESEHKAVLQEIAAQGQVIESLRENLNKTTGGKCPFLDAPCHNVEGGLDNYFSEKIREQEKKALELAEKEKQLSEAVLSGRGISDELVLLQNEKITLKNMQTQEAKYSQAYKREFNVLAAASTDRQTGYLASVSDQLCNTGDLKAGNTELLNLFEEDCKAFGNVFELYRIAAAQFEAPMLEQVISLIDHIENINEKVHRALHSGKQLQNAFKDIIDREHQTRLSESARATSDMSNAEKQMREVELRFKKLEARSLKLAEASEKLLALEAGNIEISHKLKEYDGLDARITDAQGGLLANQEAYDTYMKHQGEASKLERLAGEILDKKQSLGQEKTELQILKELLEMLAKDFSEELLKKSEKLAEELNRELTAAQSSLAERKADLKELQVKLERMEILKKEIAAINEEIERYSNIRGTVTFIRSILNKAGERISAVYRDYLSSEANTLYHEVSRENVRLEWREDYEVFLVDTLNERKRERCFRQLSGGEQMTAALAMRLGLLKQLSGVNIGFFDEPTSNLDGDRRSNLAQIIPKVTGDFEQLFVISHDDSFDSMTDNIVQLRKDRGEGTKRA